jgi:hypothetical protein
MSTDKTFDRVKPATNDKNADGTPKFEKYEDYVEALVAWKVEQMLFPLHSSRVN